MYLKTNERD
ncbi:Protein of unknown function [Bacillus mobilis]|nr:Protein of unknown function [Bacillus mobilis]